MRASDFTQFKWLRTQLANAAENIAKEEMLFPTLIPNMSKDMDY